ncbi:MAG: 5'-nucleotidase C-terminal domain-containing protein [Fusobacteriaceae bacterium]
MRKYLLRLSTSVLMLIMTVMAFAAKTVDIQFLVTSDLHGKFMPYEYSTASENRNGSAVQVSTLMKKLREEHKNTIVFENGDTVQDNSHELFLKDKTSPIIMAMNEMKYDAFVPGNHEFNFGMETLDHIIKSFEGQFLVANLYKDGKRVYQPYKIFDKEGVKVALIGVVTPHIKKWDSENLKGYDATNPVEEVKKLIPELKGKADLIVVGAHMSAGGEYGDGDSAQAIAESNPEVAVVIAGHEHSVINTRANTGAVIIEPGKWGEMVAQVVVTLTEENGKWTVKNREENIKSQNVLINDRKNKTIVPADEELVKKLESFHKRAIADSETIIGELKGGNLVKDDEIKGIPTAQIEPTAMISFINEVQKYYTGADIAAAAAFRNDANMFEGPIKKSDVALIYKYDNTLRAYELTGAQLKKFMEWSAEYYNQHQPGDLTISFNPNIRGYNYDMFSGVKYDVNISKPAGSRIENLRKTDGTPIKDTEKYVVAVNDYRGKTTLSNEKSGLFPGIQPVRDLFVERGDAGRIRDLIREYIEKVRGGVITPETENNWKITGYEWDEKLHQEVAELVNSGKLQIPASEDGRTPNVKSITVEDLKKAKK